MTFPKARWLTAGLLTSVALLTSASRSYADIQVQITETNYNGSVQYNNITYAPGTAYPTGSNPYSPAGGSFQNISLTFNPTATSLSTTVNFTASSSFDPSHELTVVVTNDSFANPNTGASATVYNQPAATTAVPGTIENQTIGNTAISSGTILANNLTQLGQTTDSTFGTGTSQSFTTANISSLPSQFAITQTIIIRLSPNPGTSPAGFSFTNTLSSSIATAAPVPAPTGLVLALAAAPVFGLRRLFRRKAAPVNG